MEPRAQTFTWAASARRQSVRSAAYHWVLRTVEVEDRQLLAALVFSKPSFQAEATY
jgi:hypothetical protein